LSGAGFRFSGEALVRSGPNTGAYVPMSIELDCRATIDAVATGTGDDDRDSPYPASRFEQAIDVAGGIVVGGHRHEIAGGGQRDRSWGPREWRQRFTLGDLQTPGRQLFTLGDLQAPGRQLYFVGRTLPGLGMGFLSEGDGVQHLMAVDGGIEFDDDARTVGSAWLRLEGEGTSVEARMKPVAPSAVFDMAHTCKAPERWLYWRTLVEAELTGWDQPCRGWFETSRYGVR
jgi:hypothetical protein